MPAGNGDSWRVTEKELRDGLRSNAADVAVATVTTVDGSAYRRPGAKMVVTETGETFGALTAGCLEPSIIDVCEDVLRSGNAQTVRFDLTTDDDDWGLGLGCNGVIGVLVEPRDGSWGPPLSALADGEPVTVATIIEPGPDTAVGDRLVIDGDGMHPVPDRNPIPRDLIARVDDTVGTISGTDATATVTAGETGLLLDGLEPTPELLLIGSQYDMKPVVALGAQAGFRVTVHAQRSRIDDGTFPRADTVRTGHPTTVAEDVGGERTYAVVMSHNLIDDRFAVESLLLDTDVPYIGLMGPRERFDRLRDALSRDGVRLTDADAERIATPVGLDLGGGDPVEIAFSIISEVLAVHNGASGGRLRSRDGPIHSSPHRR